MIKVTRLNGSELVINSDLIEFVEAIPDTIISLVTGKKIMIKETTDAVIERVAEFKRHSSGGYPPKSAIHLQGEENG
jgi:flagellar protein FlbD